jgi:hypothetical protein
MQTSALIRDAIKRKFYYDLLQTESPDSKTEFLLALDSVDGGLGCVPSGLPGCTEQARAIEGLLFAITQDYSAGMLISIAGEGINDPDEREHGSTPKGVFRVVLDFAIEGTACTPVRFPEVIGALSRVVVNDETSQGTVSAEGCRLTAGEIKAVMTEGLSVTP